MTRTCADLEHRCCGLVGPETRGRVGEELTVERLTIEFAAKLFSVEIRDRVERTDDSSCLSAPALVHHPRVPNTPKDSALDTTTERQLCARPEVTGRVSRPVNSRVDE